MENQYSRLRVAFRRFGDAIAASSIRTRGIAILLVTGFVALCIGAIIFVQPKSQKPNWQRASEPESRIEKKNIGGMARIVVSTPPEIGDTGDGGNTLRHLVYPRLFQMQPDGTWQVSLVKHGSDETARDAMSARFTLRDDAQWSDGSAIGIEDLRRSMNTQFVKTIEPGKHAREFRMQFAQALPLWRALWSKSGVLMPSRSDLYGGPFGITRVVSGYETVVAANAKWRSGDRSQGPFLDEIHLFYVPDPITTHQLLAANKVDVATPFTDTARAKQFGAIPGVRVATEDRGGAITSIRLHATNVPAPIRTSLANSFRPIRFLESLLVGEAFPVAGLHDGVNVWTTDANAEADAARNDRGEFLPNANFTLTIPAEDPMALIVARTLEQVVREKGGTMRTRTVSNSEIERLHESGSYDALVIREDAISGLCYQCRFKGIDDALAARADGGNVASAVAFEERLARDALVIPLWRDKSTVVWRSAVVDGLRANGFANNGAWNAQWWWKP